MGIFEIILMSDEFEEQVCKLAEQLDAKLMGKDSAHFHRRVDRSAGAGVCRNV